jgi:hypothetical protein
MEYIRESTNLPAPFNLIPTTKILMLLLRKILHLFNKTEMLSSFNNV